ncbi:regulatory protein RecX [Methylobacterium sp. WSM2598]|uniref:regulatory protein RecX n=1 Tax=Methylobacterium sp. WSM2598 TaxID=398261 RepID=UPI00037218A0|nr:RecX family transcriptional regulator [Methylobacterium sp. WSM2598]
MNPDEPRAIPAPGQDADRDGGKTARPITPASLERAALAYLERYGASTEMLRRVLLRRAEARCRLRGEAPEDFAAMVEAVVARAGRAGLVDDASFADAKVRSLRRRGGSARAIQAKLAAKGVDRDTVRAALAAHAGEGQEGPEEDEEAAARAYARRRRLGPWRRSQDRVEARQRDIAALARAGFAPALARRIVDEEDEPAP